MFLPKLLEVLQEPYPSEHIFDLNIYEEIPELKDCEGVMMNPFHHKGDVLSHIIKTMDNIVAKDPLVRLAGLLHDIAKPVTIKTENGINKFPNHEKVGAKMAKKICGRIGLDVVSSNYISTLILNHRIDFGLKNEEKIKSLFMAMGESFLSDLMKLSLADKQASGLCNSGSFKVLRFQDKIREINDNIEKSTGVYKMLNKITIEK